MISEDCGCSSHSREFSKCDGLGNDFIVLWRRSEDAPVSSEDARRLCHRQSGVVTWVDGAKIVGADGILELFETRVRSGEDGVYMRILNPDGSEAQMCGNGLRCAAIYLVKSCHVPRGTLPSDGAFVVETAAGTRRAKICSLSPKTDDPTHGQCSSVETVAVVEAAMGCAQLDADKIPIRRSPTATQKTDQKATDGFIGESLTISLPDGGTRDVIGTAVSMGNPHFVLVCPRDVTEADFTDLAPLLASHDVFPEGANIELLQRDDVAPDGVDAFKMIVFERGAGWTKACGTGACASSVAACLSGEASFGKWIEIRMPGGAVRVCVSPETLEVRLIGPARHTFDGTLNLTCGIS